MDRRTKERVRIDIRYVDESARPKVDAAIKALREIGFQVEHPEFHYASLNIHTVKMKNSKKIEKEEEKVEASGQPFTIDGNNQADHIYTHVKSETDGKVPVYRGCMNSSCFCTRACKEIVGYRDKLPGEL